MKLNIGLLVVQVLSGLTLAAELIDSSKRLVRTSPSQPAIWMTELEVLSLIRQDIGFFDVTDSAPLGRIALPNVAIPTTLTHAVQVKSIQAKLNKKSIDDFLARYVQFFNRYYKSETGKQASDYVYAQALERTKNYVGRAKVSKFKHDWIQNSVIVRLEGKELANETVIIGAHLDSINAKNSTGIAPGADDDGSGVATIMEVLRSVVESQFLPKRSIEFQFYSAEEVGLRGSQGISNEYAVASKAVAGMLQLDMTGYLTSKRQFKVITDYTDPELTKFLRKLIPAYTSLSFFDKECGYACSDHASWFEAGYKSCRAAEDEKNPRLHTPQDTREFVNLENALEFAKLATSFAVELAGSS